MIDWTEDELEEMQHWLLTTFAIFDPAFRVSVILSGPQPYFSVKKIYIKRFDGIQE